MMIINTHAHIYPDKVAKTIEDITAQQFGPLYSSFKVSSLLEDMAKYGIETSVVFCLAERPAVVKTANNFIIAVQDNKKLVGLGTIHPDFEDYQQEIKRLRQNGIKGIKASSIFQGFYPDEERMLRLCQELEEDLILYLHAGEEPGKPLAEARTTPQRIARLLDLFPKLKVVAAHFGGLHMLEEVKKYLLGRQLYFDTVWTPEKEGLDKKEIVHLIREHGTNKILFGTDFPIFNTKEQIEWFSSLPLGSEEKEMIFYKNAQRLFEI